MTNETSIMVGMVALALSLLLLVLVGALVLPLRRPAFAQATLDPSHRYLRPEVCPGSEKLIDLWDSQSPSGHATVYLVECSLKTPVGS